MSTSISPLNKSNIITYRNKTNNGNNDKDNSGDSGGDSDSVNEAYDAKMTYTQDEPQIRYMY